MYGYKRKNFWFDNGVVAASSRYNEIRIIVDRRTINNTRNLTNNKYRATNNNYYEMMTQNIRKKELDNLPLKKDQKTK